MFTVRAIFVLQIILSLLLDEGHECRVLINVYNSNGTIMLISEGRR